MKIVLKVVTYSRPRKCRHHLQQYITITRRKTVLDQNWCMGLTLLSITIIMSKCRQSSFMDAWYSLAYNMQNSLKSFYSKHGVFFTSIYLNLQTYQWPLFSVGSGENHLIKISLDKNSFEDFKIFKQLFIILVIVVIILFTSG